MLPYSERNDLMLRGTVVENFQRRIFLLVLQDERPRIQSGGESNAMGPLNYSQGSRIL